MLQLTSSTAMLSHINPMLVNINIADPAGTCTLMTNYTNHADALLLSVANPLMPRHSTCSEKNWVTLFFFCLSSQYEVLLRNLKKRGKKYLLWHLFLLLSTGVEWVRREGKYYHATQSIFVLGIDLKYFFPWECGVSWASKITSVDRYLTVQYMYMIMQERWEEDKRKVFSSDSFMYVLAFMKKTSTPFYLSVYLFIRI